MRYVKPHFYDSFVCTAGDCPDTCCAGWQIMIDEESLERYENEPGEFGKILRNSIDWEEECFYQNNRRCAFLNDENLMGFFEISYTNWIGSHNIYLQQNIFYMAIPILATLPFGSSFYDDINRGYARNVCVRAKKKYYLVAKYIAVFVSGGCVVAIPMVLSFLISSIFLPTMLPEASYTFTNIYPAYKWADLFYVQPLLYTSIYIFITFLFSGVTASLSLFITFFLNRKFVTFVFPFFIYIFSSFCLEMLGFDAYSIRNLVTTTSESGTTFSVTILFLIFFCLSFFPYYFIGAKKDVF